MQITKGKGPILFLIGAVLLVSGAIIFGKSEALAGVENINRAIFLERLGAGLFSAGVIAFVVMYFMDDKA